MKILKLLPVIGISILIYIVYRVGLVTLYKTLITANIFYTILALVFVILGIIPLTFKWYIILKTQGIYINFLYALKLYLIGLFYGIITPARSGSIIRASYLKDKTNKSFGECASGIILERLMDLFVIFIYATIGCIVFSRYVSNWLPIILIFFVILLLLSLILLKKNMSIFFSRFVYKFLIPEKFKEKSKEIYNAFYSNIPPFKKLIYPLILTFITWVILSIYIFIITKVYSVNIPFIYLVLIVSMVTVISLIPITVGGLGTREAALIFLFSFFGVSAVKAVSISFLSLILGNILVPFIGFFISLKEPQPDGLI